MTNRTYKGHEIIKSNTQLANNGLYLYAIDGRFSKEAGHRPFLPSIKAAKEWISDQIETERMLDDFNYVGSRHHY
jgi:hypothetical protein